MVLKRQINFHSLFQNDALKKFGGFLLFDILLFDLVGFLNLNSVEYYFFFIPNMRISIYLI